MNNDKGMTRILAVDASLNCPGFAVIECGPKRKPYLLLTCSVDNRKGIDPKTKTRKSTPQKLQEIGRTFHHLMLTYKPDIIVRERGFMRYAASTQQIYRVVGVLDLIAYDSFGMIFEEIPPTAVKQCIARDGQATKEIVAANLSHYIGSHKYATDDESDAVAVAITCAIQHDVSHRWTESSHLAGFGIIKKKKRRKIPPKQPVKSIGV